VIRTRVLTGFHLPRLLPCRVRAVGDLLLQSSASLRMINTPLRLKTPLPILSRPMTLNRSCYPPSPPFYAASVRGGSSPRLPADSLSQLGRGVPRRGGYWERPPSGGYSQLGRGVPLGSGYWERLPADNPCQLGRGVSQPSSPNRRRRNIITRTHAPSQPNLR